MKTRLSLLSLLALALCASCAPPAYAQTPRYSVSETFDLKGHTVPVVAAKLAGFTSILDRKGFDADIQGFVSLKTSVDLGFGLTHTWHRTLGLAKEFRPRVDLTIGPWINWHPGGKLESVHGGLYFGGGISW